MARNRNWYSIVLKEYVWDTPVEDIERALRRVAPEGVFWFPAVTEEGLHNSTSPFAPYVFTTEIAPNIRRAWCVESVLPDPIPESELIRSVGQPSPLSPGDRVRAVSGAHRGLEGVVDRVNRKTCVIRVMLESGVRKVMVERHVVETF